MRKFFQMLSLFLWLLPLNVQGLAFTIRDLGTLTSEESQASGINNQNIVVGGVKQGDAFVNFIWENGKGLTLLPFTSSYQLPHINNRGQIVSLFWLRTNHWFSENTRSKHLHIVNLDGSHQNIGFPNAWEMQQLKDWQTTSAWDKKELRILSFNDQQILIANSHLLEQATQFALWEKGVFKPIDPNTLNIAYKINHQGQILGRKWIKTANGDTPMLVLYDAKTGTTTEIMKDVNLLHRALNDQGQVIVFQAIKDQNVMKGWLWDSKQGLISLEDFAPGALNNRQQIVGLKISELQNGHSTLLLWDRGKVVNLNKLIGMGQEDSLWSTVLSVGGINDNGYIIGQGIFDGKKHAFVLIPSQD